MGNLFRRHTSITIGDISNLLRQFPFDNIQIMPHTVPLYRLGDI